MDTTGDRKRQGLRLLSVAVKSNFWKHKTIFMAYFDAEDTSTFCNCCGYVFYLLLLIVSRPGLREKVEIRRLFDMRHEP